MILVGEDPASEVYVRNKVNGCWPSACVREKITYDAAVDPAVVLARIAELNADPAVHGILVQLPLPKHFDAEAVLEAIAAEKDVDGFHAENVGALMQGNPRFIPCTPYGVMKMLEEGQGRLGAEEAVIVGRSNIVGKPMALLLAMPAPPSPSAIRARRISPSTPGVPTSWSPPSAAAHDHRRHDQAGRHGHRRRHQPLAGRQAVRRRRFRGRKEVAGLITPVPGGVGPMTITMLLANTLESAERRPAQLILASANQ